MIPASTATLSDRRVTAKPFTMIGSACVIAGGLVAAVIAHAPSEHGTWAVAYLVLICGVAQYVLGAGQASLATKPLSQRTLAGELITWNLGNAAVLTGTLIGVVSITDVGGVLLVVALALLLGATRGAHNGWLLRAYRLLIVIVLISIPIGLVLARVRGH